MKMNLQKEQIYTVNVVDDILQMNYNLLRKCDGYKIVFYRKIL